MRNFEPDKRQESWSCFCDVFENPPATAGVEGGRETESPGEARKKHKDDPSRDSTEGGRYYERTYCTRYGFQVKRDVSMSSVVPQFRSSPGLWWPR